MLAIVRAGFMGHLLGGLAPHPAIAGICQLFFVLFNVLMVRSAAAHAGFSAAATGRKTCTDAVRARTVQAGSFVPVNLMPAAWAWVNKAVPIAWAGESTRLLLPFGGV